jgi:hypothetical protein
MQKRYLDMRMVKLTEQAAQCATRTKFGETDFRLGFALDTWLKVQHFVGEREPINTDAGAFQSYAYFQYLQSPYTLMSAYDLWQRAYYLEAAILLRHLFEVFVQLRYFQKHPELCMNHVTATQAKARVRFDTMFNEIAPGSYEVAYRNLSTIAHGNMNFGFRGDLSASTVSGTEHIVPPFVGAQFEANRAMLIHAFYVSIALGFFNYFGSFFPKNTIATDAALAEDAADTQKWLEAVFEHKRQNVPDSTLFDALEKLVFV